MKFVVCSEHGRRRVFNPPNRVVIAIFILTGAMVSSCASTGKPEVSPSSLSGNSGLSGSIVKLGGTPEIRPQTELPSQFGDSVSLAADVKGLMVRLELIMSATTVRPRTELREGPGVEFEVNDAVLPAGERVLVYELVGSWRRIVSPSRGVRGWAHRGALRFDYHNAKVLNNATAKVSVRPNLLPMVFTHRQVTKGFRYPGMEPLTVAIPPGKYFYLLKEADGRKLIWLAETNSVVWIKSEEML